MKFCLIRCVVCTLFVLHSSCEALERDYSAELAALISDEQFSLIDAKLRIDKLVAEDVDTEQTRLQIQALATQAIKLAGNDQSADNRVDALRRLIYHPGSWNMLNAFSYDHDNPQGRLPKHKTLAHYLQTRKGNCVSMPVLFLVVAEEMGLVLSITTAPQHMFIRFEDPETGNVQHLETTSGADPQRLVWQRKVLPMTDRAIESGMYFGRLGRRQMVAVLGETLLQDLEARDDQHERFEVAQVVLAEFPQADVALLHLVQSARLLIRREVVEKYPNPVDMPDDVRRNFEIWALADIEAERALWDLGWCPKGKIVDGQCQVSMPR